MQGHELGIEIARRARFVLEAGWGHCSHVGALFSAQGPSRRYQTFSQTGQGGRLIMCRNNQRTNDGQCIHGQFIA